MPTMIRGARGTENIESTLKIVDYDDIHMLDDPKQKSNFAKFIMKLNKESVGREKYDWHTDEINPKTDVLNNGGAVASGDTAITVTNGAYFSPYDCIKFESTKEQCLVTAVNGNVLTIVRAQGVTAASTPSDATYITILGNAFAQGSVLVDQTTTKEVDNYNYTRIMRHAYKLTETEMAVGKAGKLIGGDDRARQREKKGIEHLQAWNLTAYFGERYLDSTNQRTFCGGLYSYVDSANIDTTAALTEAAFNTSMEPMLRYGSEEKVLFTSRRISGYINTWAKGNTTVTSQRRVDQTGDQDWGMRITRYLGDHGDVSIVKDNALEGTTYVKYAFLVDPADIAYVYLPGRDTRLLVNLQAPDLDGVVDEWRTEAGFKWGHGKHHGVFTSVTSAA